MSGTLRNLERILQDLGRLPEEIIEIIAVKVREMWRPPSLDLRLVGWTSNLSPFGILLDNVNLAGISRRLLF